MDRSVLTPVHTRTRATGPRKLTCTWDDPSVMMTWDNAGDNDGQGVVCILQGAPLWFTVLVNWFCWS
jgi:hypothetical protein